MAENAAGSGDFPVTVRLLEGVARALAAPGQAAERLAHAATVVADELSARHCTIGELQGHAIRPAAAVSRARDDVAERFLSSPPLRLSAPVKSLLVEGTPAVYGEHEATSLVPSAWNDILPIHALALVPAQHRGQAVGLLMLDWSEPPSPALDALSALSPLVGLGLHDNLHHTPGELSLAAITLVDDLRIALARSTKVDVAIQAVNDALSRAGIDVAVRRVAVRDRGLRARIGGTVPSLQELELCRWLEDDFWVPERDDLVLLPVRDGRRLLGTTTCHVGALPPPRVVFALAHEIAHWLRHVQLVGLLDAAYEEQARARAREEVLTSALDPPILRAPGTVPTAQIEVVADAYARERELVGHIARLLPGGRRGLPLRKSLRRLVRVLDVTTAATVSFGMRGQSRSLSSPRERALYLATASVIRAALEGADARAVDVLLRFHDDRVQVRIRDTGLAFAKRNEAAKMHYAEAERVAATVGAELAVSELLPATVGGPPTGVTVTVTLRG